ncbi:hypothetical protein [Saccharothrix australiensis]|uniref:Uncharacterized protein n=1 Tax=Saccharothrix australiensis TaxID=2072 RepID=A0A495VUN8_9PSEU|nr:hypothetical protein [Saccharothrix australiensis]RKT52145.1 hypothetical protein C8E97_0646 [Saccharothrix australiensis]
MGQLSFFSAEARPPCVADLAGLLCGPGRAAGFARGRAARISVRLEERWRGVALVAALAERGVQARLAVVEHPEPADDPADDRAEHPAVEDRAVEDRAAEHPATAADRVPAGSAAEGFPAEGFPAEKFPAEEFTTDEFPADGSTDDVPPDGFPDDEVVPEVAEPEGVVFGRPGSGAAHRDAEPRAALTAVGGVLEVATAFRTDLAGLASQWLVDDAKVVPPDFALHGGLLRLWALASGRWAESGYVLGLDPAAPATHEPLQKALAASGLPATLLKTGGPALRVVGRRRLARLAELVGRAPRGVVERTWPAA